MNHLPTKQDVQLVRFAATDGVELQGWYSEADGDVTMIHIHGMSGNGYENYFLDELRKLYAGRGISFFSIDTRGRAIVTDFRQGDGWKHVGSCFEIFAECIFDIAGAIEYLRSIGKRAFILQGHSLGCTKVVHFITSQDEPSVEKIVLLAPTDMVGWAKLDSNHESYLAKAQMLLAEGAGSELVGAECWLDKTSLSAQTYASLSKAGGAADIYGEREDGPLLHQVSVPMLVVYGTEDIGILKIDGSIEKWQERVAPLLPDDAQVEIVKHADHGFRNFELQLAGIIAHWL